MESRKGNEGAMQKMTEEHHHDFAHELFDEIHGMIQTLDGMLRKSHETMWFDWLFILLLKIRLRKASIQITNYWFEYLTSDQIQSISHLFLRTEKMLYDPRRAKEMAEYALMRFDGSESSEENPFVHSLLIIDLANATFCLDEGKSPNSASRITVVSLLEIAQSTARNLFEKHKGNVAIENQCRVLFESIQNLYLSLHHNAGIEAIKILIQNTVSSINLRHED